MKEIILDVLKKMRTDYGNNENIIFAQDSDLEVVVDELLTAINYTRCCKSDSEQLDADFISIVGKEAHFYKDGKIFKKEKLKFSD